MAYHTDDQMGFEVIITLCRKYYKEIFSRIIGLSDVISNFEFLKYAGKLSTLISDNIFI